MMLIQLQWRYLNSCILVSFIESCGNRWVTDTVANNNNNDSNNNNNDSNNNKNDSNNNNNNNNIDNSNGD